MLSNIGGSGSTAYSSDYNWQNFGHTGGVMGTGRFSSLPRFHSGLNADEYPAVLQRGEAVIPKGKIGALGGGNTSVTIHNTTGQQATATEKTTIGGDRQIEIHFANMVTRGGPMATAFEQTYGVKRVGRRV